MKKQVLHLDLHEIQVSPLTSFQSQKPLEPTQSK